MPPPLLETVCEAALIAAVSSVPRSAVAVPATLVRAFALSVAAWVVVLTLVICAL